MVEEKDLISQYLNRPAITEETEFLLAQLKRVEEAFNKLNQIRLNLDKAVSTKDIAAGAREAQAANEALIKSKQRLYDVELAAYREQQRIDKQLIDTATKLAAADTQRSKAVAIQREELRKATAEIKNQAQVQVAQNNSIDKARALVSLLTKERNSLNLATKEGRTRLIELNKEIDRNNNFVKQNVDALSQQKINIGNYPSAVQGAISSLKTLAGAYLGLAGAQKVIGFLSDSVDEFNEAQDVVNRLENALDNVGRSDALERLKASATSLMNEFKTVDDEEVIQVFDQLITYGKLTENQMNQLLPVIINFSAKQKISLSDSASVIIKALEGNGKALKEYGINIKDANGVTEAFGVVMNDLAPKVEGAAKAFGQTSRGEIAAYKVEIGNLKEEIGEGLTPILRNFYAFLAQGIKGIPEMFSGISGFISSTIEDIELLFRRAKAVATFNFSSLDRINAEVNSQREINEGKKEYARLTEQAQSIANDASKQTLQQQERILKGEEAILAAAKERSDALIKNGKAASAEGKQAAKDYVLAYETVNRLRATIAQTKDTRILGSGGKTDSSESTPIKTLNKKFFSDELKDQIEQEKKLSQAVELGLSFRTTLRQNAAEKEKQIIEGNREAELTNEINKFNAIKSKKDVSGNELINATNEFRQAEFEINQKYDFQEKKRADQLEEDLRAIKTSSAKAQQEQQKRDNEFTLAGIKEHYQKRIDALVAAQADEQAKLAVDKDSEVEALNSDYAKRIAAAGTNQKKIEKINQEFADKRADIEFKYAEKVLQSEIKLASEVIKLHKAQGLDVSKEEEALANARISLSDLQKDRVLANNQKEIKSDDEKTAKRLENLNKLRNTTSDVFNIIGGLLDASITSEKNRLQEQSDVIDAKKEKEIEAINASTLSEEEKANKIAIINARSQAQKESLDIKQRQLDERKAKFEKARIIAEIVLNTALAVVKALGEGDPATKIPRAIAAGALGAAQLAVAIATPIPKYKHGTPKQGHPGGDFIAGDGGKKEYVILPSGEGFITADKPTRYNAPKGTHVMPDAEAFLKGVIATAYKPINAPGQQKDSTGEMTRTISKKLDSLTYAVKNKSEAHYTATHRGLRELIKASSSSWRYVDENINFK